MEKIKSGIYGLNSLLSGGIISSSVTVVIGAAGTGKTTAAIQFIRRGLEDGDDGVFVSLDESRDQIIKSAIGMGWSDIQDYIGRGKLAFIDASGKQFSEFVNKGLPKFIEQWKGIHSRVAIDPLTPVIWSIPDKYTQRELIASLFKQMKKVGTVLCTLEEHHPTGALTGSEVVIPMYLADSVFHLRYQRDGDVVSRLIDIVKCRDSWHTNRTHPYYIIKGLGIIIQTAEHRKKTTETIPSELKSELELKARALPKNISDRIALALGNIQQSGDNRTMDYKALFSKVFEEYE
jgi:KaiC/GvpD/RAD55 family RecA-like ATPase